MPTGNGAYILHRTLAQDIPQYTLQGYNPKLTLFPPLLKLIKPDFRPDIVHTTPDYGIFFRKQAPLVLTFHNYVLDNYMHQYSSPLQRLHYRTDLKWFTEQAVKLPNVTLTAVSNFLADFVTSELDITQTVHVIRNGVDTNKFTPINSTDGESRIKVLFAGNMSRRKGIQWLDAIAANVKDVADIYIATGLRRRSIRFENTNIKLIGRVANDDMPRLYNEMDILLFPTVREGFGLVAAEAMACGLPVVCTDCSALPELVDEGQGGFRIPLGSVGMFSDAINELASDREQRERFGVYNRRKIIEHFAFAKMVAGYDQLFRRIVRV